MLNAQGFLTTQADDESNCVKLSHRILFILVLYNTRCLTVLSRLAFGECSAIRAQLVAVSRHTKNFYESY